jgi:hypothetical protein
MIFEERFFEKTPYNNLGSVSIRKSFRQICTIEIKPFLGIDAEGGKTSKNLVIKMYLNTEIEDPPPPPRFSDNPQYPLKRIF